MMISGETIFGKDDDICTVPNVGKDSKQFVAEDEKAMYESLPMLVGGIFRFYRCIGLDFEVFVTRHGKLETMIKYNDVKEVQTIDYIGTVGTKEDVIRITANEKEPILATYDLQGGISYLQYNPVKSAERREAVWERKYGSTMESIYNELKKEHVVSLQTDVSEALAKRKKKLEKIGHKKGLL